MSAIQAVFIRDYEERSTPKNHIVYKIDIQAHVRSWQMWRRYSEFDDLHTELTKSTNAPPPCPLPHKHAFSGFLRSNKDAKVLEERRAGLETYLRAILSAKDDRWRESYTFKEFLGVPIGRQANIPNDPSQLTSSSWLDEHSALQTLLRDVWSEINKRDALSAQGDISGSHKSNVTAKSKLAGVLSRIGILGKALQQLAMEGMSEGELQRRTDMVGRLQDDCERLGKLVTVARQTSSRAQPSSSLDKTPPAASDRQALLGAAAAKPARRVFGASSSSPPKESEVTRPLDNVGLFQLQQQQTQSQDDQLSQLTTILRRQRHLGEAINHEVGLQIEMLDDLSSEVDRVGDKLSHTNKKLNKLS
ncbi:Phox-like protein [Coprinopsis marcescibilis]|uniref:Phox-like protein n=1 Tax=Coprinopsis marcescibilis TaxID=230819 RepID=A0A5C3LCL5_COPMA|nr:Phox-like protein [Coprinopsis marcescibilis]